MHVALHAVARVAHADAAGRDRAVAMALHAEVKRLAVLKSLNRGSVRLAGKTGAAPGALETSILGLGPDT